MAFKANILAVMALIGVVFGVTIPQAWRNITSSLPFRLVTMVTKGNVTFDGYYVTGIEQESGPDVAICVRTQVAAEIYVIEDKYVISNDRRPAAFGLPEDTLFNETVYLGGNDVSICHEPLCIQTQGFYLDTENILQYSGGPLFDPSFKDDPCVFDRFIVCSVSDSRGDFDAVDDVLVQLAWVEVGEPKEYYDDEDAAWQHQCADVQLRAEFI